MPQPAASTQPNQETGFHLRMIISTMLASTSTPSTTASSCHRQKSTWELHWARVFCRVRMT